MGGFRLSRPTDVLRQYAPKAQDPTCHRYRSRCVVSAAERARNITKSQIRRGDEHAFSVTKGAFPFPEVRTWALEKNAHRLFVTYAGPMSPVRRRLPRSMRAVSVRNAGFRPPRPLERPNEAPSGCDGALCLTASTECRSGALRLSKRGSVRACLSSVFRCARLSPAFSAGEIPAPERGKSRPTGNRVLGS